VSVIVEGAADTISFTRGASIGANPRARLPSPVAGTNANSRRSLSNYRTSGPRKSGSAQPLLAALERLGLGSGVENTLTGAVVLDVTKSQLLKLAEDPSIGSVRANRFHRR
jgi:hypothetical protein